MDKILIEQKLESLRRCIVRVIDKTPEQQEILAKDVDLQDVIVLNISRAVQLCVDIASHLVAQSNERAPATMGESFSILAKLKIIDDDTALKLRKTVGFRNLAVHNYDEINWAIVYSICKKDLPVFQSFAKMVMQYCRL